MSNAQRVRCFDCSGSGKKNSDSTYDTCRGYCFIYAEPCGDCSGVGRKFGLDCKK